MFHVGQKVECLRDWDMGVLDLFQIVAPEKGGTYIVRGIIEGPIDYTGVAGFGLYLREVVNPEIPTIMGVQEPSWASFNEDGSPNFRPIIERKTDISIFTEMLTPTRQTEKV